MKLIKLLLLILLGVKLNAQDVDTHKSFLTTGISIDIPKNHNLTLYGGVSTEKHIQLLMFSPNIKINKTISVSPSYTFLNVPLQHSKELKEHHLNLMATLSFPLDKKSKWILQNRNAYFHRFIQSGEDFSFYKGRLGIVHKTKVFKKPIDLFLHNEIYISLNNGDLTRNRLYTGANIKLFKWLNPQLTYIFQTNKGSKIHDHLFIIGAIIPLNNYGIFNNKK